MELSGSIQFTAVRPEEAEQEFNLETYAFMRPELGSRVDSHLPAMNLLEVDRGWNT